MKNSKLRRALMLAACAVLLVCLSVGATLAYLTDDETVTNTFTVGKVVIDLDEAPVDEDGKETTGDRVKANTYHVYPAGVYDKDPTIHIQGDSEDCYVGVKLSMSAEKFADLYTLIGKDNFLDYDQILAGSVFDNVGSEWWEITSDYPFTGSEDNEGRGVILIAHENTCDLYICYQQPLDASWTDTNGNGTWDAGEGALDLLLFEQVVINENWNNDQMALLGDLQMNITAYAVQEDGFTNWVDALAAGHPSVFAFLSTLVWE